jgi:hypothetical protein
MTSRIGFFVAMLVAAPAVAAESLPPNAKVTKLVTHPAAVEFHGPADYAQLVVTAVTETGDSLDVTRIAKVAPSLVAQVSPTGLVRPTANGTGELRVDLAGKSAVVQVRASGFTAPPPVSFVKDVQPVLSKLGCNAGTCHGAAQGKNGFKLSLRGYDPVFDHRALTDDLEGRRFNRAAPDRSLMLMKPAGAVAHAGGVLWQPGDPYYELVRRWIADGVKQDLTASRVSSIRVFPPVITMPAIGQKQQFAVVATFTDGSKRDVTAEAFVESSNTEVATVDKAQLAVGVRRGEATMLARYEGAYAAAGLVVMGDRSGYEWQQRPVHNHVDELVDAKLKKMKLVASELCTDDEFIRRVSLDLTGLPPTAAEVRAFLADPKPSKQKRDELVDKLIGSDGFVEHWTNKWSDMLQVNRKFLGDQGAQALRKWVREAVAKNTPYDRFAYEVLTASGSNVDHPPAAYFKVLRDADAAMENTTQLFLAVRFNCNKCHDHPFEKWTQDQYYETAAYFAQVSRKEDPKFKGQRLGRTEVEAAKPLVEIIEDAKTGEVKHDRTGKTAPPKLPFTYIGYTPEPAAPRRVQLAKWLVSKDNPYFAKSYVNRIWSYLTGVGIIEPVDDIRAGNPPTNPELLDRLTADFVSSGFDTRKLMATICKSRTYQLSVKTTAFNKDDEINFSRALPRRLPAEVLFDAIHRATGAQSKLPGLPPGSRAAQLIDSNIDLPGGFLELLGKPVRESACECERSNTMMLGPVLAMVNGPIVGDAIRDPASHLVKFTEATKDDSKVVEEIYLSVLNRQPTVKELEVGVKALCDAGPDHAALTDEYKRRKAAFDAYEKTVASKLKGYEDTLRQQKPTQWTSLPPMKAESKAGPTPAAATKDGSTLTLQKYGVVSASGKLEPVDIYTLTFEIRQDTPLTGLRLEALPDDSLPKKGPGRSETGNFVVNELKVTSKADSDQKAKTVKLVQPQATFEQGGFAVGNAVDNNPATGWAVSPQTGKPHAAVFQFEKPVDAKDGVTLTVMVDQRYGSGHTLGKFRISFTGDKGPKLVSPVPADAVAILDVPESQRTPQHLERLRSMFIAQDAEYQRLQKEVPPVPPTDPRAVGAQDLAWALINTPAFLFNR